MYFKLILFSVKILCIASLETMKMNNNVICSSTGKDLEDDIPIVLNPPVYKNKLDSKNYLNLKSSFDDWNTVDSRNLSLGPVLDKRWENFPVEYGYFIEFNSLEDLTPFSVYTHGKLQINFFNNITEKIEKVISIKIDHIQRTSRKWKHYFIEIDGRNVIIFKNQNKVFNETIDGNFTRIRVATTLKSVWKRHFYKFQKIVVKDKKYDLGTIESEENLCVSLYVALPKNVYLEIELISDKFSYQKRVDFVMPELSAGSMVWQNVRLDPNSNGTTKLHIKATSFGINNSNKYWLIDLKNSKFCSGKKQWQQFIVNDAYNDVYSCELIAYDKIKINILFHEHLLIESIQNKLSLQWKIPESIYVTKYIVTYQIAGKIMCNFLELGEKKNLTLNSNETKVEIRNLEYFAKYVLDISVVTDSEIVTITRNATTNPSPYIEDLTMNLALTEDNFINLLFEDCNQFNGPLNITLSLKCLDEWCLNKTHSDKINVDTGNFQSNMKFTKFNLLPFTNYRAEIGTKRFNKRLPKTIAKLKANPGYPRPVENLTIESTSSDLTIKWKAPYPPTGIVSYYFITCKTEDNSVSVFTANISSQNYCSGSAEFLCFNIGGLNSDTIYRVNISVKNENVKETASSMTSLAISTKSGAPQNLVLNWNDFSKKFQLSWDYPDISSKSFELFYINISDDKANQTSKESKNNALELHLDNFVFYNLSVKAKHKDFSNESVITVKVFPPLEVLNTNFPIIEQCLDLNCTLTVFDTRKEELFLKKEIMTNKEMEKKLTKCLNSPNQWKLLNENISDGDYYRRVNFGGCAGLIFSLNKRTFCILTDNLLHLQFSTQKIFIVLILVVFLLVCFCLICLYRKTKQPNNMLQDYKIIYSPAARESENIRLIKIEENPANIISEPIRIEDLEKHLLESFTNNSEENLIIKQYMSIQKNLREKTRNAALLPDNTKKNRYQNILPYDSSRVILKENGEQGDYINANYIDGYNCSKEFIATQAPKFNTTEDFWLMVWQNRASSIIMMTELNERDEIKSRKYWAELFETVTFGEFKITNCYEEVYPYFIERRLEICIKNERRSIDHLQFTDWPDHGVPSHPQKIVQFLKKVLELPERETKIVHCNAGCGRTGSLILCEIALRMALNEGIVDFPKILEQIRKQRVLQVNSFEQYVFCYLSVVEYLKVQQFSISLSEDFVINSNLKSSLNNLVKLSELISLKNERELSEDSDLSYEISLASSTTISVDSFTCRNKFIAVARPAKAEIRKFWQLVKEFNVNVIIFLDQVDFEFSFKVGEENRVLRDSILQCTEKYESLNSSKTTLNFDNDLIFIHEIKNWKNSLPKGECERSLISVLKELSENFRKCKILVVSNEIARSGLFIGLSLLVEKMISERVFDVFSAIRMLRQNEFRFLQENEQIDYLYEFGLKYLSANSIIY